MARVLWSLAVQVERFVAKDRDLLEMVRARLVASTLRDDVDCWAFAVVELTASMRAEHAQRVRGVMFDALFLAACELRGGRGTHAVDLAAIYDADVLLDAIVELDRETLPVEPGWVMTRALELLRHALLVVEWRVDGERPAMDPLSSRASCSPDHPPTT